MGDFEIEDDFSNDFSSKWQKKTGGGKSSFFAGGADDDGGMYDFDAGAGLGKKKSGGLGYKSPPSGRYGSGSAAGKRASGGAGFGLASKVGTGEQGIVNASSVSAMDKASSLLAKYGSGSGAAAGGGGASSMGRNSSKPLKKLSTHFDEDDISVGSDRDDLDASNSFEMSSPFSPRAISEKAVSKSKSIVIDSVRPGPVSMKNESLGQIKGITN